MKFFVDTADVAAIAELADLGMVDGVTTNPSLILKSGRDIIEVTREICAIVPGPVSAEVVALKADEMIAEGRRLAGIAPNIAVKVPLTWDGLKACRVLSSEGRMVNVTLCFSANQALVAAKAALALMAGSHCQESEGRSQMSLAFALSKGSRVRAVPSSMPGGATAEATCIRRCCRT